MIVINTLNKLKHNNTNNNINNNTYNNIHNNIHNNNSNYPFLTKDKLQEIRKRANNRVRQKLKSKFFKRGEICL